MQLVFQFTPKVFIGVEERGLLVSLKGNCNASVYKDILATVWGRPSYRCDQVSTNL